MHPESKLFLEVACNSLRGSRAAILSAQGETLRTFGQLGEQAQRAAEKFLKAGFEGQLVIVALENCPEWLEIFLGLLLAGAVPLLCEPAVHREVAASSANCGNSPLTFSRSKNGGWQWEGEKLRAPSGAFLMKSTSGITSARRAVIFSAAQFAADVENVSSGMGISESDINLAAIPFSHSYGLTSLVGMLLLKRVPMVLAPEVLPRPIASALCFATVFPGVPAHYRALLSLPKPEGKLRLCLSAAAPLSQADARAFAQSWGLKIHSFYGASECGGICYDASDEINLPEGFVGNPLTNVQIEEIPVPDGLMLKIGGPAVALGYWPATEDAHLQNGFYRPADILLRSTQGYCVVGRQSDIVNIAGRKVHCAQVEERLRSLPSLRDVAVFSLPAPGGGEALAACVVTNSTVAELRKHCGELFAAWEIPKHWFVVEEIPVDARGKISRSALRKKYMAF